MPATAPALPGIPGVDLVGSLTEAIQRLISQAIHGFASSMFARLSEALLDTTAVPLGPSFDAPWRAMLAVAALFALPILLAGVTTEVLAGRPAQALRRGVLLPLLIGPVLLASRAVLGLLVALVQGACGLMVEIGIGGEGGFAEGLDRMRQALGVAVGPADPLGVTSSLVVVLFGGLLAFIIWVELALRAAMLLLLAAFVPLALSGLFWSATARWTRRLLESLAAVLLAPLVITMVMVLAAATLTAPVDGVAQGVNHAAVALALLFLGTLGLPMTFRLVPLVVEAAVVAGAGATVASRARRGATRLAAAAPTGGAGTAARLAAARPAGPATRSGLGTAAQPLAAAAGASAGSSAGAAAAPVAGGGVR
ncbi:MAG: hypothetical protein Q8R60_14950 [Mycobacteriales bacterium]|nr:hypothetical protein [Mycobacteriales bacterium]